MNNDREQALLIFYDGLLEGRYQLTDLDDYIKEFTGANEFWDGISEMIQRGDPREHIDQAIDTWHTLLRTKEDSCFIRSLELGLDALVSKWTKTEVRIRERGLEYCIDALTRGRKIAFSHWSTGGGPVLAHCRGTHKGKNYVLDHNQLYMDIYNFDPDLQHEWVIQIVSQEERNGSVKLKKGQVKIKPDEIITFVSYYFNMLKIQRVPLEHSCYAYRLDKLQHLYEVSLDVSTH